MHGARCDHSRRSFSKAIIGATVAAALLPVTLLLLLLLLLLMLPWLLVVLVVVLVVVVLVVRVGMQRHAVAATCLHRVEPAPAHQGRQVRAHQR